MFGLSPQGLLPLAHSCTDSKTGVYGGLARGSLAADCVFYYRKLYLFTIFYYLNNTTSID